MPGANCSMYGCGTSRKHKDIGIFKLPLPKDDFHRKWRQDLIDIILRFRVLDESLERQINEDRIHICQRHFREDQFYVCKLIYINQVLYAVPYFWIRACASNYNFPEAS